MMSSSTLYIHMLHFQAPHGDQGADSSSYMLTGLSLSTCFYESQWLLLGHMPITETTTVFRGICSESRDMITWPP